MTVEELKDLINTVSNSNLKEFKYEENDKKIYLKNTFEAEDKIVKKNNTKIEDDDNINNLTLEEITSPLVGTVYMSSEENGEPFVKEGDEIKEGNTVAIVEAMKLMNEIECEFSGVIKEILVENGQTVEYGQPLFRIEKR